MGWEQKQKEWWGRGRGKKESPFLLQFLQSPETCSIREQFKVINFTNLVIQEYSVSYVYLYFDELSIYKWTEPRNIKGRFPESWGLRASVSSSPLPLPLQPFFFCSRSNVCAITLLETLATQARYPWTSAILQKPSRGLVVSRPLTVNQVNSRRFIDWFSCCVQRYGVVVL